MQEKALYLTANFDSATQDRLGDYYNTLFQNEFIGIQAKICLRCICETERHALSVV